MEKIEWGPNWEEILGGEFAKRRKDKNFRPGIQKDIYGQFENTFMMYLPRLCEHCLNPTCVASLPQSGPIYKREEDGIVLIDQDKCRGWRMCVSGCPYKKIYLQLENRQVGEVHLLLPADRSWPTHRVLRNLRRSHPLSRRAAL
jgi:nitrate reductase beta subunit